VKYCDDNTCGQSHYARCGGVSLSELNALEVELFAALEYRAHVNNADYKAAQLVMRNVMNSMMAIQPPTAK
jgi:hypothetical protein